MNQQVRVLFRRRATRQLDVGTVHGVASLECHDLIPAPRSELGAQFRRRVSQLWIRVMLRRTNRFQGAAYVDRLAPVNQCIHSRMLAIGRAEDLGSFVVYIRFPNTLNIEHRKQHTLRMRQRQTITDRQLGADVRTYVQRDRHRPQCPVRKSHLILDALVVHLVHEPCERRESASDDLLCVTQLAWRERQPLQIVRFALQLAGTFGVHQ